MRTYYKAQGTLPKAQQESEWEENPRGRGRMYTYG